MSKPLSPESSREPLVRQQKVKRRVKADQPRAQWPTALGVGLAILALAVIPFWLLRPQREQYVLRRYQLGVVERGTVQERTIAIGTLGSADKRQIYATAGGMVRAILVREGDDVQAGAALLRLDSAELQATLSKARAALAEVQEGQKMELSKAAIERDQAASASQQAQAAAASAQRAREAAEALYVVGGLSQNELSAARDKDRAAQTEQRAALKKAQATAQQLVFARAAAERKVAAALSDLERIQQQLQGLTIRSPIAGRVSNISLQLGKSASAGSEVLQISSLDKLRVELPLGEELARRVQVGQQAEVRLGEQAFKASVKRVSSTTTAGTDQKAPSVPVFLEFDQPPAQLRMGSSVDVLLNLSTRQGVLALPRGAYLTTGGEKLAYVQTGPERAERREVIFGAQGEDKVEVLSGLQPGERVVLDSYEAFKDQAQIRLAPGGQISGEIRTEQEARP